MFLKSRTLAHRISIMRSDLEAMSCLSLCTAGDLKSYHVQELLASEIKFKDAELLPGTIGTLIFDAMPRLREVFNTID